MSEGFPGGTCGKHPACPRRHKRCRFDPWVGKIPWRRAWQPTLVFLPGESHGQRSQQAAVRRVGKSQRGLKRLGKRSTALSECTPSQEWCRKPMNRRKAPRGAHLVMAPPCSVAPGSCPSAWAHRGLFHVGRRILAAQPGRLESADSGTCW